MEHRDVLIVGSGHAGVQTAHLLRQGDFKGSVSIASRDDRLPYERPALSKDFLAGNKPAEKLLLRPEAYWADRNVELRLNSVALKLDPKGKTVSFENGSRIRYGSLVWAAGGEPRRLTCPGSDLPQVYSLRSLGDAVAIQSQLPVVDHVTLVGGGYIGLELAAVMIRLGKSVTLVEIEPRILARVAGSEIAAFLEEEHRKNGVEIRLGTAVESFDDEGGGIVTVQLSSGEVLRSHMVIAGIGIIPSVGVLSDAGAAVSNGVLVDEYCQSSLPDVFAIGDCASHTNRYANGRTIRLESIQNANDQAAVVAKLLCGSREAYNAVPRFWSSQYDLRLQTIGLPQECDQTVVRGDPKARSFSIIYILNRKVIAMDSINAPRDFAQGRRIIEEALVIEPDKLADPNIPL